MHPKTVHIIGGGTVNYVANHLAISAPAYGKTAKQIAAICSRTDYFGDKMNINLTLTKMADEFSDIETNEDLDKHINQLVEDPSTKVIFMTSAVADFNGYISGNGYIPGHSDTHPPGKYAKRPNTRNSIIQMDLFPAPKIIYKIRQKRKDIFLVGFKSTSGATADEQYSAAMNMLKESSCNLVLANDAVSRLNMVVTPEEARYHQTTDRYEALNGLVEMTYHRSHLTFTRSTVVDGQPIPWNSELIPSSLREIVNYCIKGNAYKPFRGSTVGHFACRLSENTFLTSIRKSNFNDLDKIGMVKVVTDGPDTVLAYGAKPSVGGQSQRTVFMDHEGMDAIVHFHSPIKTGSEVPVVSQRLTECGSHECGRNTSGGLKQFGNLKAVYLDNHGPNIVFNSKIDPQEVIDFIEANFDLAQKTGGYLISTNK